MNASILMAVTDYCVVYSPPFCSAFYVIFTLGNLLMIIKNILNNRLQTPMPCFLRYKASLILFSQLLCYTECWEILSKWKYHPLTLLCHHCTWSSSLVHFLCVTVFAYDSYIDICKSLIYTVISQKVYWALITIPMTITIKNLIDSFCGHGIHHFYNNSLPLFTLICSGTYDNDLTILISSAFNLLSSISVVLVYL